MMDTPTATPCLACGTIMGTRNAPHHRPVRKQGHCGTCYNRLRIHGQIVARPRPQITDRPLACLGCQTTRWGWYYARGLCPVCYKRAELRGIVKAYPGCGPRPVPYRPNPDPNYTPHPTIPTGIITPAMLGITADEIAERCADAAYELALTTGEAMYRGLVWRERHPEQYNPDAIAALYPDPAGLACSAWAEDAARVAA